MFVDKLRNNKILIIIIILPIICFITRKISYPLYSIPLIELNDKSFFGESELYLKNNTIEDEISNMKYNNKTRVFIQTKFNKIILYFTFSKYKYYEDFNSSFDISFKLNESNIINDNTSINYSENFINDSNIISIKYNKRGIKYFFNKGKKITLNNISFKYDKENKTFKCKLIFRDFDLLLNLHKEKYTYKFYYLFECTIGLIMNYCLFGIFYWEYNYQNIYYLFIYIVWAKINIVHAFYFYDLFKIGILMPILNLIKLYPHLLIYGEFVLSISDIFVLASIISLVIIFISNFFLFFEIGINIYYCFHNKIVDNEIVIKETDNIKYIFPPTSIIPNLLVCLLFVNSVNIQCMALLILICMTYKHHMSKREVMCKKDNIYCISFYTIGISFFIYYLIIDNLGEFYKRKPPYSIFFFVLIFISYILLYYVITRECKSLSVMKQDFEIIKKLDKDCCAICLRNFDYNKIIIHKYFCEATDTENIHKTNCNHYFHEICLFRWRKYRNICPICKYPLTIPEYYYFYDETPCIYKPDF